MKKILSLIAVLLVIGSCAGPKSESGLRSLNLGKQKAAIALEAGSNDDVSITSSTGNSTTLLKFEANDSGSTLSGMDSSTVDDGDMFFIRNDGDTGDLTITNGDTASLAANRFKTATGASLILPPFSGAAVVYDSTLGWTVLLATSGSPKFVAPTTSGTTTLTGAANLTGATSVTGTLTVGGKLKAVDTGDEPVLSSCGSTPSESIVAGSSDVAGKFTTGGTDTNCVLTFDATWGTAPTCFVTPEGSATQPTYTVSATAITFSVNLATTTYNYFCIGR